MKLFAGVMMIAGWLSAQQLPEGKGKDALIKVCTPCHGAENVIGEAKTREEWGQLVGEMVSFGAQGTDEELNLIVDYLARHFPKTPKKLDRSRIKVVGR
jgi:mono/diheme cytochrome c family protein